MKKKHFVLKRRNNKWSMFLAAILVVIILLFFLIKRFSQKSESRYMSGIVSQVALNSFKIKSDNLSGSIEISNAEKFPRQFLNVPAEFRVKTLDDKLEITDVKSLYHSALNESIKSLPQEKYQKLYSLLNDIESTGAETDDAMKHYLKNNEEMINEIKNSYFVASREGKDDAEIESLIKAYKMTKARQEVYSGKAYYIKADNYIPEVYQEIYGHSQGSAAIFRKTDNSALCSGVLIAKDKILTCLHCMRDIIHPDELVVKFGYEENSDGSTKVLDEYPVIGTVAEGVDVNILKQKLDFAVLETGQNPVGNLPGDKWPVQSMAIDQVIQLDDAVYVVGYPNGERKKVHDNSYVYWPYEINEATYHELELRIQAEFIENKKLRKEALQEFKNSYKESTTSGGRKIYRNYSTKWKNMPTIGVNCSTFHGNSGSPLYLKRKDGVVGILFDGSKDNGIYVPGWEYHEAIIPMKEIARQLDGLCPGWQTVWKGVRIEKN